MGISEKFYSPLVSVITPALNQAEYLPETIRSVAYQDCPKVEHVIVDNGSTDGTLGLLKKYQRRYPKLRWTTEPEQGIGFAYNVGLKLARGDIFGWLDCGGTYFPWTVGTVIEFFEKNCEAFFMFGDCFSWEESGEVFTIPMEDPLWQRCFGAKYKVNILAAFYRREVVQTIGVFDTQLKAAVDHDFFLRAEKKFKFHYIKKPLAVHRRLKSDVSYGPLSVSRREELRTLMERYGKGRSPW